MRLEVLASMAFLLAACGSEHVEKAATCSDPCCNGEPALLDCAESPDVSCTAAAACGGSYGCMGGMFFSQPSPACDGGTD